MCPSNGLGIEKMVNMVRDNSTLSFYNNEHIAVTDSNRVIISCQEVLLLVIINILPKYARIYAIRSK
jgi:hypothetical protein